MISIYYLFYNSIFFYIYIYITWKKSRDTSAVIIYFFPVRGPLFCYFYIVPQFCSLYDNDNFVQTYFSRYLFSYLENETSSKNTKRKSSHLSMHIYMYILLRDFKMVYLEPLFFYHFITLYCISSIMVNVILML